MKKMLITGGTVFVSRFLAEFFAEKYDVYVLNRNTRPQSRNVTLIQADRHFLGECLKGYHFDVVLDTAYTAEDIHGILDALGSFDDYILISSSAVYPETEMQPFTEETTVGENRFWGIYGTNKIAAEKALQSRVPNAYVLRPPYLYGPGNNVYREAFVFECAEKNRTFYLPGDGGMKLQFFHIEDLCRAVESILEKHPENHVFNVGNPDAVTVKKWVELCYQAVGVTPEFISVSPDVEQRLYFPFYRYEYMLDVGKQRSLIPETKDLETGLAEAYSWYREHKNLVVRKPLIDFMDKNRKVLE